MSVLSQTRMSTGGTCSCPRRRGLHLLEPLFPLRGDLLQRAFGFAYTTSGLGRFDLPGSRSPGSKFSLIAFPQLEVLRIGPARRIHHWQTGDLTMPLSMASTRPKSLTIHGNGRPSG